MTPESTDTSWLDSPEPTARIVAARSLVNESKRGAPVSMTIAGKGRTWHSDGKYVWFRRKKANPATTQRLNDHLAKGEIKFIVTSDDVEMYEVLPHSPFFRGEQQDLMQVNFTTLKWIAIRAAKAGKWEKFVDTLSEIASRIKGKVYSDGGQATGEFARMIYSESLNYIFRLASMAGGPAREVIDQEVQAVQSRRGSQRSEIILPPPTPIATA